MFDQIKILNEDGKLSTQATINGKSFSEPLIPFDTMTPENIEGNAYLYGGQLVSSMEMMLLLKRISEVQEQDRFNNLFKRVLGDKAPEEEINNPFEMFSLLQSKMADREALSWAISQEFPEEYKAHVNHLNLLDIEADVEAANFDIDAFYPNEMREKGIYDLKVMKSFHEEFPDVVQGNSFVDTLKTAGATLGRLASSPNVKMALGGLSLTTAVVAGGPFAMIVGPLAFANAAIQHPTVSAVADKITDKFVNTLSEWGWIKPETAQKVHTFKDKMADKARDLSKSRSMRWMMTGLAVGGVLLGAANVDSVVEAAKSAITMVQDGSAAELASTVASEVGSGIANAAETVSNMSFGEFTGAIGDTAQEAATIVTQSYDESLNVLAEGMANTAKEVSDLAGSAVESVKEVASNTVNSVTEFAATTAKDFGTLADGMQNAGAEFAQYTGIDTAIEGVQEFASITAKDFGTLADGMQNAGAEFAQYTGLDSAIDGAQQVASNAVETVKGMVGLSGDELSGLSETMYGSDATASQIQSAFDSAEAAAKTSTATVGVAAETAKATAQATTATAQTASAAAEVTSAAQMSEYVVKSGDNLWNITKEMMGPGATDTQIANYVNKFAEVNNLANPDLILPGQVLTIPEAGNLIANSATASVDQVTEAVKSVVEAAEQSSASSVYVKGVDGSVITTPDGRPILNSNSVERIVNSIADKDSALSALIQDEPESFVHLAAQSLARETVTIGSATTYTAETLITALGSSEPIQDPAIREELKKALEQTIARNAGQEMNI